MQTVGAAWLMVSLGAGPMKVALIQTASTLPFFVLAMPAGALGDIMDRRRLILVTEYWMLAAAIALAVVTLLGAMSPWLLLGLTFVLSAGDACQAPSWRALLPDLVDPEDLPAASALNGMEFNLARAVGPALAGLLIAGTGVSAAFVVNAASFFAVIAVVTRWHPPARRTTTPTETLGGATIAALRYVRHSPTIRALLLRTGGAMFFATAIMALLPVVAHRISGSSLGYGVLLGFFGSGAILGAITLPRLRTRLSLEAVLTLSLGILSVVLLATGTLTSFNALCPVLVCGGAAWMMFISLLVTMAQQLAPAWVRARVLAVFLLVFQGSMALGSVVWGLIAEYRSLTSAFVVAAGGTAAAILFRFLAPLPDIDIDLTAWDHWAAPALVPDRGVGPNDGPVLIMVEYRVEPEQRVSFVHAAHRLGRLRRRDGASRWGIFRDTESIERYVETFIVNSWAEHLRQHARSVKADQLVEEAVRLSARDLPVVRHFIYSREER